MTLDAPKITPRPSQTVLIRLAGTPFNATRKAFGLIQSRGLVLEVVALAKALIGDSPIDWQQFGSAQIEACGVRLDITRLASGPAFHLDGEDVSDTRLAGRVCADRIEEQTVLF